MSDAHPNIGVDETRLIRSDYGVIAEPDDVNIRSVVIVGVVALVLFFLSGLWAWWLMERFVLENTGDGVVAVPAAITQYEIGIVNQRPFDLDTRAEDKLDQQAAALNGYSYVDQQAGKVRVPIALGMQQVIAQQPARPNANMQQGPADAGAEDADGGTSEPLRESPGQLNRVPGQQGPISPP